MVPHPIRAKVPVPAVPRHPRRRGRVRLLANYLINPHQQGSISIFDHSTVDDRGRDDAQAGDGGPPAARRERRSDEHIRIPQWDVTAMS
ncbi:hypothetical protein GCM10010171_60070 [Actinokineospora fastidiosa]|uniref:Uncharacterized protein n=1 Tax=Actinokineospora fastidiosa TaxID=1816 RepID=A0A918GT88_9PSEU|nr:hypothetical protein GCM10010171_60070 [Actinokineospora fastidiosa]